MTTTQTETITYTAALHLNQKLHLVTDHSPRRCAGTRLHPAIVSSSVTVEVPEPGMERRVIAQAARAEALAGMLEQVTDQMRANLCEKCAEPVVNK